MRQPATQKRLTKSGPVPAMKPGSRWVRLSKVEAHHIPELSACYVVFSGKKVLYVGSATKLYSRLVHGHRILDGTIGYRKDACNPKKITVAYRPSVKLGDWAMVEIRLIKRLKPSLNGIGPVAIEKLSDPRIAANAAFQKAMREAR